jgi:acetyl-CoA acetyltransferase
MNDDLVPVIVGGARTPFGKFRGALSALQATDLGAHAISAALEQARRGSGTGVVSLCGGGGQGDALILRS